MRVTLTSLTVVLAIMGGATSARAQESGLMAGEPTPFITLDRTGGGSFVSIDTSLLIITEEPFDPFGWHLSPFGQVISASGFGGYVSMPFNVLTDFDNNELAVGNLELGGVFDFSRSANALPGTSARAGVTLPTAGDGFEDSIVNSINQFARITDLVHAAPEITYLRLSGSYVNGNDQLTFRGDLGIDVPVSEPDGVDAEAIVRLNAGVRLAQGPMVELTNLIADGESITSIAVGYGNTSGLPWSIALVLPIEDDITGELIGISFAIRPAMN